MGLIASTAMMAIAAVRPKAAPSIGRFHGRDRPRPVVVQPTKTRLMAWKAWWSKYGVYLKGAITAQRPATVVAAATMTRVVDDLAMRGIIARA